MRINGRIFLKSDEIYCKIIINIMSGGETGGNLGYS